MRFGRIITSLLTGALLSLLLPAIPVSAGDESSVDAEVEVLPEGGMSYGASVQGFHRTLFARWALGGPDDRGALILMNGWVSIKLENTVSDAGIVSVWVANHGWHNSQMRVYVSADGRKWKQAGNEKVTTADFQRYDFTGSFGEVRYIKVSRSGGRWSFLSLDAAGAKGGDSQEEITSSKSKKLK